MTDERRRRNVMALVDVTSRYGLRGAVGVSEPPYDSFNLGSGVADDLDAVRANRSALATELGLEPGRLIFMNQVHGVDIAQVSGPWSGPVPQVDGMVSVATDIGLVVLVADCVPVLAADRTAGVIGAAHAGRLGAAAGIVPALFAAMIDFGATPAHLEALVGPAICGKCYEVPEHMRDEVDARLPGSACTTSAGTAGLDLRAGIIGQLRALGVGTIELDARCTREDPELFSHRRSAPTGRFAAVVRQ